jgi:hypothetical protein
LAAVQNRVDKDGSIVRPVAESLLNNRRLQKTDRGAGRFFVHNRQHGGVSRPMNEKRRPEAAFSVSVD